MLYVMLSNGKCTCAAFRPLSVTKEQANKCEYPVSGSVRLWPEHISAVTDSVLDQWRPDCTINSYFTVRVKAMVGVRARLAPPAQSPISKSVCCMVYALLSFPFHAATGTPVHLNQFLSLL